MLEIVGMILILIGAILLIKGIRERTKAIDFYPKEYGFNEPSKKIEGGGVVIIGPIPIVLGDFKYAVLALILAISLIIITLIMLYGAYT